MRRSGVHRFTFDGRYAYISPTMEAIVTTSWSSSTSPIPPNLRRCALVDARAVDAGGEERTFRNDGPHEPRCHTPSAWASGCTSATGTAAASSWNLRHIQAEDALPPRLHDLLSWPTHSLVPIPFPIFGHR